MLVFAPSHAATEALLALAAQFQDWTADDQHYLAGPIVLHGRGGMGGWPCPAPFTRIIPLARLALLLSGEHVIATEEEALVYYHTASLCAPLHLEDMQRFFYLAQVVLPRYGLGGGEPVWKMLGEQQPYTPSAYDHEQLTHLRRQIRAGVIRAERRRIQTTAKLEKQVGQVVSEGVA